MSALLVIHDLAKAFGGIKATDHVSLDVQDGEIHALIGPNGAGKTTLINQICGELHQDGGTIALAGMPLDGLDPAARARCGLGRTFQIVQLIGEMSVRDNVTLAIRRRKAKSLSLFGAPLNPAMAAVADRALDAAGWTGARDVAAADLSHGEQKLLELAIALALDPKLLLLDEPMAGLGPVESAAMIDTLAALKGRVAMLLVEHDMDAVFALADRISVLVYGRIVATGKPDAIRANREVRTAYLGEGDA